MTALYGYYGLTDFDYLLSFTLGRSDDHFTIHRFAEFHLGIQRRRSDEMVVLFMGLCDHLLVFDLIVDRSTSESLSHVSFCIELGHPTRGFPHAH